MFTHYLKKNNTGIVVHEADHEGTIKSIIELAYSNHLKIDVDIFQDVCIIAKYLRMTN